MSGLCATRIRTISPHRKTLLVGLSSRDASPHRTGRPKDRIPSDRKIPTNSLAAFSTSCGCQSSNSQSTYVQQSGVLKKDAQAQVVGRGRGSRVQQQESVSKVLHQVHLSSWAKGGLGSIFNGLGSFANRPSRLVEEVGRLLGRSSKKENGALVVFKRKDAKKMKEVFPVIEQSAKATSPARKTPHVQQLAKTDTEREQHSFQKAMEDTHDSIVSFYHAYTTPDYVPSKPQEKPEGKASPKPSPKPVITETDVGWSFFRKFPLQFSDANSIPVKKKPLIRKDFVSRSAIEARTRALVTSLRSASSYTSKIVRTQDLCKHLKQFPSGRHEATECKAVPVLLQMTQSEDKGLKEEALEALCLLGYHGPVRGRGIRILTLDGGGTRGLMTLQCMEKLEEVSGKPVYEMFDFVCGVSTGALIAAMVCLYRLPLDTCRKLYTEFSNQMFSRSRVFGTTGLVWNHAFYDSDQWEQILQAELGQRTMIEFSRDPQVPKMAAISTVINMPRLKNFVFRNYNLPPSTYSAYSGSCHNKLWEVIRASSAAPGYYEDFRLGDYVHSDGGLSNNNPTAMAVHEARLLWPHENIQCVVSLGTGRWEPQVELGGTNKVSLKEKVGKVVDSVTDTEGVHVMMNDLMPPATYFRFNPYLSEDLLLDEIRSDRLEGMQRDATMYLRKNDIKIRKAVETLTQTRMAHQHAMDWVKLKSDTML
ncbi:calcium-independent phospholipase A2-gamma-like [Littorina saxatilis]|uniref:PNPLA domain-containing protein n=1 Tax=Littorina saxatilis TaxID=31220 RepID=A0AAN9BBC4_9CAEN